MLRYHIPKPLFGYTQYHVKLEKCQIHDKTYRKQINIIETIYLLAIGDNSFTLE